MTALLLMIFYKIKSCNFFLKLKKIVKKLIVLKTK